MGKTTILLLNRRIYFSDLALLALFPLISFHTTTQKKKNLSLNKKRSMDDFEIRRLAFMPSGIPQTASSTGLLILDDDDRLIENRNLGRFPFTEKFRKFHWEISIGEERVPFDTSSIHSHGTVEESVISLYRRCGREESPA